MGWFSNFEQQKRRGQIALTVAIAAHYGYTISDSQQKALQTAVTGWTLAKIWGARRAVYAGVGWVAWTPAFWALVGPQIAGGVVTRAVWGEEGLDDYVDFMGDVYTGIATADSSQVEANLAFTWDTLVHKKNRSPSRMTQATKEWWAGEVYWEARRRNRFQDMIIAYNAMTPAEQQDVRRRIQLALP